ncbi:unnamed protein product [Symbiodinium sp. CCMP2592]|nr:unnamed protein product [Symbiodinium sp. CCMP2592]
MDTGVGEPGWIVVLDTLCSAVFLMEVIAKLYVLKPRQYFCGPAGAWNVFDVVLTGAAVLETVLSFAAGNGGSQSRVAMMLRGLRIARLARVAKLMRMPLLQKVATIVTGFFINLRPLFWVWLTLFMVVYFLAVLLRATLEAFRAARSCGDDGVGSEECESLVMVFSDGFGMGFDLVYAFAMVVALAEELFVTEEEFLRLIRKTEVQQLLCDMDINVEPREGILAAFVTEEDGSVSMSEIVSGLMRFRGDLHKIDLAIARSELENLQRQVAKVMQHIENHA